MSEDRVPSGPPRRARFDGILEGRIGDEAGLSRAVSRIRGLGIVHADLQLDGGRFSWMPDDRWVRGDALHAGVQQQLVEKLDEMIVASAEPARVESTLRCTMDYGDQIVETVFRVERGRIRPLSRVRAETDSDRVPEAPRESRRLGGGRLALIGLLLAFATGLVAWQSGLLGGLLGPAASDLAVERGPFATMIEVEVAPAGLGYAVVLSRGPGYPKTGAAVEALERAAGSPIERAAVAAVAEGRVAFVRLVGDDGTVLVATPIGLTPLLEERTATVELPARLGAARLTLGLDSGD